ncbi:MAG: DNA polymerase II [Archangium sp.]
MNAETIYAFVLAIDWRDTSRGLELTLWASSPERGVICATFPKQEAVMFVARHVRTTAGRRVPRDLKTKEGAPIDAVYFTTQRALIDERTQLRASGEVTLESDVKPSSRFAMERFIKGGVALTGNAITRDGITRLNNPAIKAADVTPSLRTLSLDIETDGWDGPVLSVAFVGDAFEHVLMTGSGEVPGVTFFTDERSMLEAAFRIIREHDPDAILGWNVVDFDLRVLGERATKLGLSFTIGRAGEVARVLEGDSSQSVSIARVPGRVVLDGVATLRNASWAFERYTLEHVAQTLLGRGKKREAGVNPLVEIRRMHREDQRALAAYNLEDARLVRDIFAKGKLIEFLLERTRLTGLLLDRQGGSVAAFDYLYLPKLHRRGYVAPDVGTLDPMPSPGGHVLEGVPGLMRNVASFDFRSLYPSIVRTFQVDPLALWVPGVDPVDGFEGARFARTGGILPEIITGLHHERTRARDTGNETLSTAIKILMNSFYGVLGTPGSRFFDPRLATSITKRGHEIIERSKQFFEARGHQVVYGDTDSLFVRLPESLDEAAARSESKKLASEINAYWKDIITKEHRLESHLEMRFDALFLRFLMPSLRGQEKGSKKRYAGLVRGNDGAPSLVIRGLEAIRTDWTPLAREAQREFFMKVFTDQPWEAWLLELRGKVLSGALDQKLIYRRRLRRDVDAYEANLPPHVKAARMVADSDDADDSPMSEVEYLMTTKGPQPIGQITAPIDYAHYLDRQLAPALDVLLERLGTSWDRLAGNQLQLFE